MEPIFDRDGSTVAWRLRDVIYDRGGRARSFVHNRGVYSRTGQYLGRFEDGFYRDRRGRVVAFERGATGGPLPPVPRPMPVPPVPEIRPPEPRFEPSPKPPMRAMQWSDLEFGTFLEGVGAASG